MLEVTSDGARLIRNVLRDLVQRSPALQNHPSGRAASTVAQEAIRRSVQRDVDCERIKPPCGGYWKEYYGSPNGTKCEGSCYQSIRCCKNVNSTAVGFRCSKGAHTICFDCADLELEPEALQRDGGCIVH
eukprot:TRINITY_DN73804_c0_g1_i1.p1 TRINITY_DN73804_c0_g1~~TRINITY_DN73804_c0_g1_i1.p1  ORF type:complete len:130 (+),score=15.33 TRINITY_DN73804_c0_g1_i1:3-392(+)